MTSSNQNAARKFPLPAPRGMYLKVLHSTGSVRTEYPTIILSYLDVDLKHAPDEDFLTEIQAFSTDFTANPDNVDSELELVAYGMPKEELLDFSDGHFLKCIVDTKKANDFFVKVEELGRYAVLVNTNNFTYRALVDDATGEVLEAVVETRKLH